MSNCPNKKHGWIEEKKFSHRQEKKIQKKTIIDEVSKTVVSSKNGGRWEKFQSKTSHVSRIWRGL